MSQSLFDRYKRLPPKSMRLPPSDMAHPLFIDLQDWITDAEFPCVGAKAALARGRMSAIVLPNICSSSGDGRLHAALLGFIARARNEPRLFQSFAVIFEAPDDLDELAFERHLWARVQAVSNRDVGLGHSWDERVSADPASPHFSLSFAGEAFFVVGLHPRASRPARRFRSPVLVFNMHAQFEQLRAEGKYDRLRETILERDEKLAGSANPMLQKFGEASEARQYSGRSVGESWRCPFSPNGAGRSQVSENEEAC